MLTRMDSWSPNNSSQVTLGVMLGRAEDIASRELNCTILCCKVAIVLLLRPEM